VAAQIASLVAALVLLNASLTFENVWPTPFIKWTGQLSAELAIVILALSAFRPRRVRWLSGVWVLLVLGHYADVTAPALYGRDVNLYWDLRFIPDVVRMVTTVARAGLVLAVLLGVAVVLATLYLLVAVAWHRVGRAMADRRERITLVGVSLAGLIVFSTQQLSEHLLQHPRFAMPVSVAYARQARFAFTALTSSAYVPPSPVMGGGLAGVKNADVYLVFIEAYGAVTYTRPEVATALTPVRADFAAAVRDTRRGVVSAFVESPTFGGSSWLAHISLLSGIEVKDPDRNARLMTERRDSLPRAFGRNGFRTVALMPGLRVGWPEGAFYGFDEIYGAERLAYRGPEFGWFAIPDEYSLQRVDALEMRATDRAPVFVFFPTISTHFPFNPIPPYQPDWSRMTVRAYGRPMDWVNFTPVYADAIAYDLTTLAGYLRLESDRDLVMVVLGDHQPAAAVSGEHASWSVPVHVIANRAAVLDKLRAQGFVDGLTPQRSLGKMNELTPRLLAAFQ
jgi:sulfatase-like protein